MKQWLVELSLTITTILHNKSHNNRMHHHQKQYTHQNNNHHCRDQLTWHMEDPLDKILKQYESLPHIMWKNKYKNSSREERDMYNHNDTWNSSEQGHTLNNTPNNCTNSWIIEETPPNGHVDKTDDNINMQTCYGWKSRKLDRLMLCKALLVYLCYIAWVV